MDTGNGSRITATATEHNSQAPMQGLADAHNSLANDHHGGEPLYHTVQEGFLLILDDLFDLHHCTLKVTVLCKNMTIDTAMEIVLPPLVTPNRNDQCVKSICLGMVLDVMTGIVIKATTHRGPSTTIVGTTRITMMIDNIKLHQFLASMMNINTGIPIDFFRQTQVIQRKIMPLWGGPLNLQAIVSIDRRPGILELVILMLPPMQTKIIMVE
jgi:hypothetical protein